MVRSHVLTSECAGYEAGLHDARRKAVRLQSARAGWILLAALALAGRSSAQVESAGSAAAKLLETLLDRAKTTAPGTYAVTAGSLKPAAPAIPLAVQADAFRGPDQTIRVALALSAEIPQRSDIRLRIVTPAGTPAGAPRVVADATASGQSGRLRLVREFTLGAGEYEIQAAVGHPRTEGGVIAALAKSRVTIPDVWSGLLAVTPIVLADAVSAAPRTPGTRAFVFGPTAMTPAMSNAFAQNGDLHVAFRVFNWKAEPGKKPDLTAEYTFYQQTDKRLIFFNKIKPQHLGADTLGEAFDPAAGVVTAGMTVPLLPFPYGEFELKVRVTDNATKQSAERQVRFVVSP
jgi:hypothetical protein